MESFDPNPTALRSMQPKNMLKDSWKERHQPARCQMVRGSNSNLVELYSPQERKGKRKTQLPTATRF